jgi:hypothetical protein
MIAPDAPKSTSARREAELRKGQESVQRHEQSQQEAQRRTREMEEQEEQQLKQMQEDPGSLVDAAALEEERKKVDEDQIRVFQENNDAVAESDPMLAAKIRGDMPEGGDPVGKRQQGAFAEESDVQGEQQTWTQTQPDEQTMQKAGEPEQGTRDPRSQSGVTVMSQEELEQIEQRDGIAGLRRVAGPLGVRGRGKEELIREIMQAQEKAAASAPVRGLPDARATQSVQPEDVRKK